MPDSVAQLPKPGKAIVSLLTGVMDKGYSLYIDNWYSSIPLYTYLQQRGTDVCGIIKKNMVPKDIRNTPCPKGEQRPFRRNELLSVKLHYKKEMFLLTTMHEATTTAVWKQGGHNVEIEKPDCILSYNKNMGGVDHVDRMLEPYNPCRKTLKWFQKLMVHYIQIAMLNAYIASRRARWRFSCFSTKVTFLAHILWDKIPHMDRGENLI